MRNVYLELEDETRILIARILIICPVCHKSIVGPDGTKKGRGGRVESFQCYNHQCAFLKNHKQGKQFSLTSSYKFKQEIWCMITELYSKLVKEGAKNKSIANEYSISEAHVSHLRQDLENAIKIHRGLDQLISIPQPDRAIAIDETFLKIGGKNIYIIIATGYTSHKTLGLKVSKTRNEKDIREVFEEADANTEKPILTASADAWGATQACAKNLNRDFTLIIHKHKKPYDKAVIRQFTYKDNERTITDIGVKVDVFKRRVKREFRYREKTEPIIPLKPQKVGRPRGVKNGQGKKKRPPKRLEDGKDSLQSSQKARKDTSK